MLIKATLLTRIGNEGNQIINFILPVCENVRDSILLRFRFRKGKMLRFLRFRFRHTVYPKQGYRF
jgi:hypothetical protein